MPSANVCGSSWDCFLLLSIGAVSVDFICIGLYEISHNVAKAALAAAFFANFFDGPETNDRNQIEISKKCKLTQALRTGSFKFLVIYSGHHFET